MQYPSINEKDHLAGQLREGVKKSKWKFKMAFAMKGGGGLEGVSSAIYLFWKMIFLKTI